MSHRDRSADSIHASSLYRLANGMLFALMDHMHEIADVHLDASLAIWEHSGRTLKYVFGADLDDNAEKIKRALRKCARRSDQNADSQRGFQEELPSGP